ncbi:MAG: SDR family NAD(P)-dependent oxidoreductase, partial [Nitrospira sp.]|nr:SDR family NAD(P)-dependent oxidoreductase [Nitrospira sp.]
MNAPIRTTFANLVELVQHRAHDISGTADRTAFTFLANGEQVSASLTFQQLDSHARNVAAHLQRRTQPRDRVLLVYPPGLEYITAFLGCLYAGVIAIPALPPANPRTLPRLQLLAQDAQPRMVLTLTNILERVGQLQVDPNSPLYKLDWLAIDTLSDASAHWTCPTILPEDLAFLQYTSGSTGNPKGVMVTHANILANAALSHSMFGITTPDVIVSWLPPHHDFGLIGSILSSIYAAYHSVQFSPAAFVFRPYRWLKALSDYRARITGAPNFAYDLCVNKITEVQKQSLDLSALKYALNGAEPIRPDTLRRFVEAFAPCGLRPEALTPVYGLAESTLLVSANTYTQEPIGGSRSLIVSKQALSENAVQSTTAATDMIELISTGRAASGERDIIIVDPVSLTQQPEDTVGEIWVSGPSVAQGYWNRPEESQQIFQSRIVGQDVSYLRTGDLGFLHNHELYVTGRMKDMMIFNGGNIYPQDIEATVERIDPALRTNGCAAFSLEHDGKTQLVIIQEVESRSTVQVETFLHQLRGELIEQHGIFDVLAVLLIKAGGLPRTSSGKIQRSRCRELYSSDQFTPIWQWKQENAHPSHAGQAPAHFAAPQTEAETRLVAIWKELLGVEDVATSDNFFDVGGNSLLLVELHARLTQEFSSTLRLADLFRYPTISSLASFLSGTLQQPLLEHLSARAKTHLAQQEVARQESSAVAIIGMSGRFPGARDLSEFWANLVNGVESITSFSSDELHAAGVDRATAGNSHYVNAGALLPDIDLFDAKFFGFLPREAEITDPQHRVFLECSWEALEDAGYDPTTYKGTIGVFAGSSFSTYLLQNLSSHPRLMEDVGELACAIGNDKDYLATRTSFKLNLRGPSMAVQTACSTSLVAVHMACQSLLMGDSDIALAGGVSIRNWEKKGYLHSAGSILSADGHCRAFDSAASGTVFGSGVGVVILKRLERAIADGDSIYAVIKGSAINNDGSGKVGYTAPSTNGQALVIAEAQAIANVSAESISYIEAHGTATTLGDPIEIDALTQAFRITTDKSQFCALGSVKTNVGHLDAAAGITGLIKTVLALKHHALPPSLHFRQPNPQINFTDSPFFVNTELRAWDHGEVPRRAGVSSFGFGGTNVHMILEEAPIEKPESPSRAIQILLVSAKSQTALDTASANLAAFLKRNPNTNLADAAFTSQIGRHHFSHRRVVLCRNLEEAITSLENEGLGKSLTACAGSQNSPLVFMFPGQGSQYVNMARELYDGESVFRAEVDTCSELLHPWLGRDLRQLLFPEEVQEAEAAALLAQTQFTQPALFVIEYALARQLNQWGILPSAMLGHSIGEYVAACLSGVFSLPDALAVVAQRGQLIASLPTGAMLAVSAPERTLKPFLNDNLSIAAVNAPSRCTVSGTAHAIGRLAQRLSVESIPFQTLPTSHAFHSGMMAPILETFAAVMSHIKLERPSIPFLSNVSGDWIAAEQAIDPMYWVTHVRQTVRFGDGLEKLIRGRTPFLLEVGPGRALCGFARQYPIQQSDILVLPMLPHPTSPSSALQATLTTVGKLWLYGAAIDWAQFSRHEQRRRVPLPTYPFERQRYWIEPSNAFVQPHSSAPSRAKENSIPDWFYLPSWKRSVCARSAQSTTPSQRTPHLIFIGDDGLEQHVIENLKCQAEDLILVRHGEEFSAREPNIYTINHAHPEDYARLLADLVAQNRVPVAITHFWGVTSTQPLAPINQNDGFYSLLYLAQAIGALKIESPVLLNVVSNGVYSVLGNEVLFPEKATVLGPCQVVPLEYPNIRCRHIDLVIEGTHPIDRATSRLLASEIGSPPTEAMLAYRGEYRWTQTFEPMHLPDSGSPLTLRQNGHYLVTGGLGGIGLAFASYLSSKGICPNLTLIGRSSFPARSTWHEYLATHDEHDRVSHTIRQLCKLEEQGARLAYFIVDISNEQEVERLAVNAADTFGPVHGIFHAAGVLGDRRIQKTTAEEIKQVFAPKLDGTRWLDQVFHADELDFFALCSSVSAHAPIVGQVDYCAANAFLDAFAHHRRLSQRINTIAINWNVWKDVGMAAKYFLGNGISAQDAPVLFDTLLASPLTQVMVSPIDVNALQQMTDDINAQMRSLMPRAINVDHMQSSRPHLATAYIAPRNALEQTITDIWQHLFGMTGIGIHDHFFELGGHSLLAVQLVARLQDTLQVEVPLRELFTHPTVAGLATIVGATAPAERPSI